MYKQGKRTNTTQTVKSWCKMLNLIAILIVMRKFDERAFAKARLPGPGPDISPWVQSRQY